MVCLFHCLSLRETNRPDAAILGLITRFKPTFIFLFHQKVHSSLCFQRKDGIICISGVSSFYNLVHLNINQPAFLCHALYSTYKVLNKQVLMLNSHARTKKTKNKF